MGRSRYPAVAPALLLVLVALPARAETTLVSIDAPCPPSGIVVEGVAEILRAQLTPLQVVVGAPSGARAATAVEVTIDACNRADETLEIVVAYRGAHSTQRIDLGDVALNARSRTLALALAESVHHALDERDGGAGAQSSGAARPPQPAGEAGPVQVATPQQAESQEPNALAPNPVTAPDAPLQQPAPRPRVSSELALRVAPFLRYAFKTATPYVGLHASTSVQRFDVRLRGLASRRSVEDSSVWHGAVMAALGATWLTLRNVTIGSELEAGAAWAVPKSGESSLTRTAIAPHVGGSIGVRLVSPLARHWFLESELGVGVAASLTAQAYHVDLMSLSGLFVQTSLGVGWSARPF